MGEHVDPYRQYLYYPHPKANPAPPAWNSLEDFFGDESPDVASELTRLLGAHGTKLFFGQRHFAPSATWRDELGFRMGGERVPERFVVRVHLFEDRNERAGRYLGFVSLRPPKTTPAPPGSAARHAFRYVIDAELAVPPHMQRPRYHVLTTTAASPRLGVLPFRSAVYSSPGLSETRGSTCVHLAVSQALHLVMGRFGCRPISQIEFDWHLWRVAKSRDGHDGSIGGIGRVGANLEEALKVIQTSCEGGGYTVSIEPRTSESPSRLSSDEEVTAVRYLTDALACGLPVIALVRTGNLLRSEDRSSVPEDEQNIPHAILVLGMHLLHGSEDFTLTNVSGRVEYDELPGRVVVHDTLCRGPYFECTVKDLLKAAQDACIDEEEHRGVHFLVIGPKEMNFSHARAWLMAQAQLADMLPRMASSVDIGGDRILAAICKYLEVVGVSHEAAQDSKGWRLACRLMSESELELRYNELDEYSAPSSRAKPNHPYFWAIEFHRPDGKNPVIPRDLLSGSGAGRDLESPVSETHERLPTDEFLTRWEPPPAMVMAWSCHLPTDESHKDPEPVRTFLFPNQNAI